MPLKTHFEAVLLTKEEGLFNSFLSAFRDGEVGLSQAGTSGDLKTILREKPVNAVILDAAHTQGILSLTIEEAVARLSPLLAPRVILVLLERNAPAAQTVALLGAGAHEVSAKPVRPRILAEQIKALIRAYGPGPGRDQNIFSSPNNFLVMDYQKRRCFVKDLEEGLVPSKREIVFTKVEFQVLHLLLAGKGALVTYETFRRHLWPTARSHREIIHTLHQLVTNIRKKIGRAPVKIDNLRSEGFRLS